MPNSRLRPIVRAPRAALALALLMPALASAQTARADSTPLAKQPESVYTIALGQLRAGPYVGATLTLPATVARDGATDSVITAALSWATSDPRTAWVSPTGQVTFLRPGPVTITASYRSSHASATMDVKETRARRIDLAQSDLPRVAVGDTVRFAARVMGDGEQPIADAPVTYALATRGIVRVPAQIGDDGAFVAREPGLYMIVASFGGLGATATVNVGSIGDAVTPDGGARASRKIDIDAPDYEMYAGTTVPLSAATSTRPEDASYAGQPLRWTSSDTSIAWVDQQGIVRLRSSGRVKITVTGGNAAGTHGFTVAPNPVRKMVFNAPLGDLHVGDEMKLKTYVWGRGGYALNHMRVNYAVKAHPGIGGAIPRAMVTEDGLFMAEQPGTFTLIAESGGLAEQMTVLVGPKQ